MARDNETLATQERIFRIAQRNGLTLSAISLDSEIPYNTIRSYAGTNGATAEMPVSALRKLVGVIPDELLSLLLPETRAIVQVPSGCDVHDLADHFRDFLAELAKAQHPASPDGEKVSDCERAKLAVKIVPIRGKVAA